MDRVRRLDQYRRQKDRMRRLQQERLDRMRRRPLPPRPSGTSSLPAWAWLWIGLFAGLLGCQLLRLIFP